MRLKGERRKKKVDLREKKLFLLDMDGTIYLDNQLFDGALDFLSLVRSRGGRCLFLTNNSSRSVESYVTKLRNMGIPVSAEDFITSADAMALFLKEKYGIEAVRKKKIYFLGTESFKEQMRKEGFLVADRLEEGIDSLVVAFDRELTFAKLEEACILLNRGVDYFATNPDWVCPTAWGYVPDCGSICQMLENATGRKPYFVGKPEAAMIRMALKQCECQPKEALLIGDRLYTDIACGVNGGIDTIFVLSGEGTLEDLQNSTVKPSWIAKDIKEIAEVLQGE